MSKNSFLEYEKELREKIDQKSNEVRNLHVRLVEMKYQLTSGKNVKDVKQIKKEIKVLRKREAICEKELLEIERAIYREKKIKEEEKDIPISLAEKAKVILYCFLSLLGFILCIILYFLPLLI